MNVKEAFAAAASEAAVSYLKEHGFQILDRDLPHDGEIISILAVERHTFVVVDLRVCAGTRYSSPLDEIGAARRQTIRRFAARWLAANGKWFDQIRVDVIGLVQDGSGGFTVEHVRAVAS